MKALLVFLCLAAGVGGGALGALLVGQSESAAPDRPLSLVPDAAPASVVADEEARADLASLRLELANLRASIEVLRTQINREPVQSDPVAAADGRVADDGEGDSAANLSNLSEEDKEAVIALVEESREQRRQEQLEARQAREDEWALERATEIANELGLAAGSEKRIGEIMLERNAKINAMRAELNDLGWGRETREIMREQSAEISEWQKQALTDSFGEEVAGQIQDLTGNRGGRGGRGGGNR